MVSKVSINLEGQNAPMLLTTYSYKTDIRFSRYLKSW